MRTSRSTLGSLGHATDTKNVYLLHVQTELMGILTNRKRKPPLKEDAVPSIFSYVPEKKVRQASIDRASRQTKQEDGITWQFVQVHQSRLPRRDRVVSSAVYSTASGGC